MTTITITRAGAAAMRHSTWILFALLAVVLLASPAHGAAPMFAFDQPPAGPVWLTPQILAGIAACIVAVFDGLAKLIKAWRCVPGPVQPTKPEA